MSELQLCMIAAYAAFLRKEYHSAIALFSAALSHTVSEQPTNRVLRAHIVQCMERVRVLP